MQTLKGKIRHSFDNAAQTYDSVAPLQEEVARRMMGNLEFFKVNPKKILDLGSGTGLSRKLFAEKFPRAETFEIDIAFNMLSYSRTKHPEWTFWPFAHKHHHICADIEYLPLKSGSVDFVWSNLVFEWGESITRIIENIRRVLRPGGLVMFSTLGPDTLMELKATFDHLDVNHPINQFLDMHDIGDQLIEGGLLDPVMDAEILKLEFSSFTSLISTLKKAGSISKTLTPSDRIPWSEVEKEYSNFVQKTNVFPASFEIIYGHAWAPESNVSSKFPIIKIHQTKS